MQEWVYGIKFDFASAISPSMPYRPGLVTGSIMSIMNINRVKRVYDIQQSIQRISSYYFALNCGKRMNIIYH